MCSKKSKNQQNKNSNDPKEKIWNNIERTLFPSDQKRNSFWKNKLSVGMANFGVITILVLIGLSLNLDDGIQGMLQSKESANESHSIKRKILFENASTSGNRKDIPKEAIELKSKYPNEIIKTIQPEGIKEEVVVHLKVNEDLGYIIYVDQERFSFENMESGSRIEYIKQSTEIPDMYMEIEKRVNTTAAKELETIKKDIERNGHEVVLEDAVVDPINARVIISSDTNKSEIQWDTLTHRFYITEAVEGVVFIFKQTYISAAEEGLGVRFNEMISDFQVVK